LLDSLLQENEMELEGTCINKTSLKDSTAFGYVVDRRLLEQCSKIEKVRGRSFMLHSLLSHTGILKAEDADVWVEDSKPGGPPRVPHQRLR